MTTAQAETPEVFSEQTRGDPERDDLDGHVPGRTLSARRSSSGVRLGIHVLLCGDNETKKSDHRISETGAGRGCFSSGNGGSRQFQQQESWMSEVRLTSTCH